MNRAFASPLLPPAIFALDACLAWHEFTWHVYSCALDFHTGYMAALGVGAVVTGLWMAAMMEGVS